MMGVGQNSPALLGHYSVAKPHMRAFEMGRELRAGVSAWVGHYNDARPHSALGGRTPSGMKINRAELI
jgi:transposase InsO family protein